MTEFDRPRKETELSRRVLLALGGGAFLSTFVTADRAVAQPEPGPNNTELDTADTTEGEDTMPELEALETLEPGEPVVPHIVYDKKEIKTKTNLLSAGPWHTMPGASRTADGKGVKVVPTGLEIVDKRNNNQRNPNDPINLFGPRLQVAGNFNVTAQLEANFPSAFSLYGEVPMWFDDNRWERSRLDCQINGDTLLVRIWLDGQEIGQYNLELDGLDYSRRLSIDRRDKSIIIRIDDEEVVQFDDPGLFDKGQVWFGLKSEKSTAVMRGLSATPLDGDKVEIVDASSMRLTEGIKGGLKSLAKQGPKGYKFHIGAAASLGPMVSDPQYAQLYLGGEVHNITIENALKPQNVQPKEGLFLFGEADALIRLAQRHHVGIHGHTLMYDRAMPLWMEQLPTVTTADRQRVRNVLEKHVRTVARHYKGQVESWDVLNETIAGFNDQAKLNDNVWLRAMGEEYIDLAFRVAHEEDPQAKLYLNDYGLETNPQGRGKFMISLAKRMISRGTPIHGIGIQGHVYQIPRDAIDPTKLATLMADINALGLEAIVTEHDVTGANGDQVQADQFAGVVNTSLRAANCTGYKLWGLDDKYGSTGGVWDGQLRSGTATIYTTDRRPKAARAAIVRALESTK